MIHPFSSRVRPDLHDLIWHYARGQMPCYVNEEQTAVGWVSYGHRGVQFLDKVDLPKGQLRYIFHPKFTVRYNRAFEQTLRCCATGRKEGRTWISPEVFEAYMVLHRAGFAHSYETWQADELVGGAIGVQIGAFITCETMFHHVSNASKAAWGQTAIRLRERGFEWVDTNCVASHRVNFGEEWVPQWRFERMVLDAVRREPRPTLADDIPAPPLPALVKLGLPLASLATRALRKVGLVTPTADSAPSPSPSPSPETSPAAEPPAASAAQAAPTAAPAPAPSDVGAPGAPVTMRPQATSAADASADGPPRGVTAWARP